MAKKGKGRKRVQAIGTSGADDEQPDEQWSEESLQGINVSKNEVQARDIWVMMTSALFGHNIYIYPFQPSVLGVLDPLEYYSGREVFPSAERFQGVEISEGRRKSC